MNAPPNTGIIETDAVVVGAGPVGLFQVFQLGLLDIRAHVIDTLPFAGGQCVELYPDKPIYDIPAVAVCTGRELTQRLLQQIAPFRAAFHYQQEVTTVARQDDGRFLVATSVGTQFLTKTLFIAAGVGAFKPRSVQVAGLDKFAPHQLLYAVNDSTNVTGKHLVIVGGDETALSHVLRYCNSPEAEGSNRPASVTLLHRRDVYQACEATVARIRTLSETHSLHCVTGQITGYQEDHDQLTYLTVHGADAQTQSIPVDILVVSLGLSPKLGPVAQWGLDMERRQLHVDTATFTTSEPGIFAIGDINTYPGKKKLIVCGFHEATLAAYGAAAIIFPDRREAIQYTTTSPRLHKLLGVQMQDVD
jgi:thioredoxin reductase (NADPH)